MEILNQPGKHQVLAVSPSRGFYGGDARFEEFSEFFETARKARSRRLEGDYFQRKCTDKNGSTIFGGQAIW